MTKKQWQYLLLLPALLLLLTGCGSSSDDSDDDDTNNSTACTTSNETILTVPDVTYTEIDETSDANDSASDAQLITTNTIVNGSLDSYGFPAANGDDFIDFYKITVTEGDEFIITLEGVGEGQKAPVDFFLFLDDGTGYNTSSENAGRDEKIAFTVPSGMTLLNFYVDGGHGAGDYKLTVTTPPEAVAVSAPPSEECQSNFNGVVTSAITGGKLEGVTVNLRQGEDNKTSAVNETTTTDANGAFAFEAIQSQDYTVELQLADHITSFYNVELPGQKTIEKVYSLSPTFTGDYRIVLNWGALPSDLDSYMKGPKADGSGTFTVNWINKSKEGTTLDRDDISSYGPETTTIVTRNATQDAGEYNFIVVCIDPTNGCTGANATVTIFNQEGVFKQVTMPTEGSGLYWNVFTITGDTYNEINEILSESPL